MRTRSKEAFNPTKKIKLVPRTKLNASEVRLSRELRTIWYRMRNQVIDELSEYIIKESLGVKEAASQIPINIDDLGQQYENDIFAAISPHKRKISKASALFISNQLKVPFDTRYYNNYIEPVIMERTFKIVTTKITKTMADNLRNTLQSGIEQGATPSQIIKHMKMLKSNHKTIARTEINTAANEASHLMATKELGDIGLIGVAVKGWTFADFDARDAHIQAGSDYGSGNEIPIEESFIVGGEPLMHPGDSSGSAGNIINCRCTEYILPAGN